MNEENSIQLAVRDVVEEGLYNKITTVFEELLSTRQEESGLIEQKVYIEINQQHFMLSSDVVQRLVEEGIVKRHMLSSFSIHYINALEEADYSFHFQLNGGTLEWVTKANTNEKNLCALESKSLDVTDEFFTVFLKNVVTGELQKLDECYLLHMAGALSVQPDWIDWAYHNLESLFGETNFKIYRTTKLLAEFHVDDRLHRVDISKEMGNRFTMAWYEGEQLLKVYSSEEEFFYQEEDIDAAFRIFQKIIHSSSIRFLRGKGYMSAKGFQERFEQLFINLSEGKRVSVNNVQSEIEEGKSIVFRLENSDVSRLNLNAILHRVGKEDVEFVYKGILPQDLGELFEKLENF